MVYALQGMNVMETDTPHNESESAETDSVTVHNVDATPHIRADESGKVHKIAFVTVTTYENRMGWDTTSLTAHTPCGERFDLNSAADLTHYTTRPTEATTDDLDTWDEMLAEGRCDKCLAQNGASERAVEQADKKVRWGRDECHKSLPESMRPDTVVRFAPAGGADA